jgi:hypothetical protein
MHVKPASSLAIHSPHHGVVRESKFELFPFFILEFVSFQYHLIPKYGHDILPALCGFQITNNKDTHLTKKYNKNNFIIDWIGGGTTSRSPLT